jgi:hypothetical protein
MKQTREERKKKKKRKGTRGVFESTDQPKLLLCE